MTLCHVIDDCEPVEYECDQCDGRIGDACCPSCGGDGSTFFSRSDLYMLASNLATAAALCKAWELGAVWGVGCQPRPIWHPGCQREAP